MLKSRTSQSRLAPSQLCSALRVRKPQAATASIPFRGAKSLPRLRQAEADGEGIVYHGHLAIGQMAHVLPEAAFVDGADLL